VHLLEKIKNKIVGVNDRGGDTRVRDSRPFGKIFFEATQENKNHASFFEGSPDIFLDFPPNICRPPGGARARAAAGPGDAGVAKQPPPSRARPTLSQRAPAAHTPPLSTRRGETGVGAEKSSHPPARRAESPRPTTRPHAIAAIAAAGTSPTTAPLAMSATRGK